MLFYRVLGNKQGVRNLLVAEATGQQLKYFIFPFADIQLLQLFGVGGEFLCFIDIDLFLYNGFFLHDHFFFHDLFLLQFFGEKDTYEQENDTERSDPYFGGPGGLKAGKLCKLKKDQYGKQEQSKRNYRVLQEKVFSKVSYLEKELKWRDGLPGIKKPDKLFMTFSDVFATPSCRAAYCKKTRSIGGFSGNPW